MLSHFRKLTKLVIWVVIIAFVGTIILVWGMEFTSSGAAKKASMNIAGTIDGVDIPYRQYSYYLDLLYRDQQEKQQDDISVSQRNQMRRQAWDNLVAEYLVTREMDKRDIYVSDEEFYQFLKNQPLPELQQNPNFQTDGKFDYNKYLQTLANPQAAQLWANIEAAYRPELRKQKLYLQIVSGVRVSEDELRNSFIENNEKAKAEIIYVPTTKYSIPGPEVTDEEIQSYYEQHKSEYTAGERRALNVVIFSKEPTEDDWEAAKAEILAMKSDIDAGKDFAELAMERSEDPGSAVNGGDLGFFGRGQMVTPFEDAAFSMKVGELSEPVRSRFGYHLIKVTDKKMEDGEEKVKASHILLKVNEASTETLDLLYARANELINQAHETDLKAAAENMELEVKNTGLFEKDAQIPEVGQSRGLSKFAFDKEVGEISNIVETDDKIIVAEVAQKVAPGIASFEEVKMKARAGLVDELSMTKCEDEIKKIDAALKGGTPFAKAGEDAGYKPITTEMISRTGLIRGLGRDPIIIGKMFAMKNGEISDPVRYNRGWCIIRLLDTQGVNLSDYSQVRDSLEQGFIAAKQQEAFNAWYVNMVSQAQVDDYLDEIFSGQL